MSTESIIDPVPVLADAPGDEADTPSGEPSAVADPDCVAWVKAKLELQLPGIKDAVFTAEHDDVIGEFLVSPNVRRLIAFIDPVIGLTITLSVSQVPHGTTPSPLPPPVASPHVAPRRACIDPCDWDAPPPPPPAAPVPVYYPTPHPGQPPTPTASCRAVQPALHATRPPCGPHYTTTRSPLAHRCRSKRPTYAICSRQLGPPSPLRT